MPLALVVQARHGSTRLSGKVLLPAPDGRPMLRVMLDRISRTKMNATVAVATTTLTEDDAVADVAKEAGAAVIRGSVDDVLSRFHEAAHALNADVLVRLTGDCPLHDPALLNRMGWAWGWAMLARSQYLRTAPELPEGMDAEWFTVKALSRTHQKAKTAHDREHVTPYMRRYKQFRPTLFRPEDLGGDYGHIRVTLDYEADYQVICAVLERLGGDCTMQDIIALYQDTPALFAANQQIERNEWEKEGQAA